MRFVLEAVLTADHPGYRDPRAGEQYCCAAGDLVFAGYSRIEWLGCVTCVG
ncbi:hypothetical protein [Nocardia huaxiensis]|uniref:hypothetical protein n=1 Tax=Nocardia huaxiensis TaxID=2755382 RepID=UPI001E625D2A|nr:hypothetical protein [Nocardia huaxiensis]UFS95391.1 hypothetical protein LPY97_32690 [Nocardia huaxiensis]